MKRLAYILIILGLSSCNKDRLSEVDIGYDFYPLEIGNSWIYAGDSIIYNSFSADTSIKSFQIKEKIASIYIDNAGDSTYQIEVYKRQNENDTWLKIKTFPINLRSSRLERVEENQRVTTLAFPITASKTWDGNAFNSMEEQIFSYENINEPFGSYDSTISVVRSEFRTSVNDNRSYEWYAKGVGLISKELYSITIGTNSNTGLIDSTLVDGYEYRLNLIAFE